MKRIINFTTSADDVNRYASPDNLIRFYRHFGCDGLEVMPLSYFSENRFVMPENCPLIRPDMVIGVHLCCTSDWMDLKKTELIEKYRRDLDYACHMNAEYVVFHVTQVSDEESYTYRMRHRDEEVILAAAELINELLSSQDYPFYFLMENLWWPGLNFLHEKVRFGKKGLLLDTGHFLHTNPKLKTQKEGLAK